MSVSNMGNDLSVHYSSKSANWNTPSHIVPMLLEVLGEIDLDPCSNDASNPNIPARVCYDGRNIDGLSVDWIAKNAYMNSPYGRIIGKWTRKALKELALCHVPELIMLTPARTDAKWFQELWVGTICFVHGRLKFTNGGNVQTAPAPFPSAFVYFGNRTDKFSKVFGQIGTIAVRRS